VVGDIHGQLPDLLRVLDIGGRPRDPPIGTAGDDRDPYSPQYLFLGDYVDRGLYSTEVMHLFTYILH
jgi:hypothetical protein